MFSKVKCKILPLEMNGILHAIHAGWDQLHGKQLVRKEHGVLIDILLNKSQQYAILAKTGNNNPGCVRNCSLRVEGGGASTAGVHSSVLGPLPPQRHRQTRSSPVKGNRD